MPPPNSFLTTLEVRWFLGEREAGESTLDAPERWVEQQDASGPADRRQAGMGPFEILDGWIHTVDPYGGREGVPAPEWGEWRTDVYLLLPTAKDMGIKWREEQLQIKGRLASLGPRSFAGSFQGHVESWAKWSYAGMPEAYRTLFESEGEQSGERGLMLRSVRKRRCLRKVHIDPRTSSVQEVPVEAVLHRGVTVELTNLELEGRSFCSLAFEAFPDDPPMISDFTGVVQTFLGQLEGVSLDASNSLSYPAWLSRLAGQ